METTTSNTAAPSVEVPRLIRLLVDADSLMCVLDNITRGYRKHEPDDPDCWCNGCVNPRAVSWMESFREMRSEMEANAKLCRPADSEAGAQRKESNEN